MDGSIPAPCVLWQTSWFANLTGINLLTFLFAHLGILNRLTLFALDCLRNCMKIMGILSHSNMVVLNLFIE